MTSTLKPVILSATDSNRPAEFNVSFYKKYPGVPSSLNGQITAVYLGSDQNPKVVHSSFRLPLKVLCRPVLPSKTATYKVTIDTNKAPVSLNDIFPGE